MSIILRIDMTNLVVRKENVPEEYVLLGGRALTSRIVKNEVPATCHPLRDKNKLVIAPGLLTGTKAASSGRISFGSKSPLTGTIKESNAGGVTGQKLARLGIKAIVVEGLPKTNDSYILFINKDGAEIKPSGSFAKMGTYEFNNKILQLYGKVGIICIGPAGEMKMLAAGIANSDMEGRPSRYAARGGLGAVMGSKGLKAIIIDDTGAPGVSSGIDNDAFNALNKQYIRELLENPVTNEVLPGVGTLGTIDSINAVGGLPTRNFSTGVFEGASTITGPYLAELVKQRGGKGAMGHPCHPGCVIRCSNVLPDENGEEICAPVEYETGCLLGSNLGIDVLDNVGRLNYICNDVGLDTIETGGVLGILMEAGVINFGDGPAAISLLNEVAKGSVMGRVIGSGAYNAAKVYGVTRVPTTKGQTMAAYDPRAIKGIGVTYATCTMGADHTIGYTISPEVFKIGGDLDPLSNQGKIEASRDMQTAAAFVDSSGICLFATFAPVFEIIGELVNAQYGVTIDPIEYGKQVLRDEREFNAAAGFTKEDDRIPEFMLEEILPPHNQIFDVNNDELDKVHNY